MSDYTLLVFDGELTDVCELDTNLLRYDNLTRDAALDLAEKSLKQGYTVCAWMEEGAANV